jgi:hypothetical protein
MNLTRERIRQVEVKALAKLEALNDMYALRDYVDEGPVGKRRLPTLSKEELAGGKTKAKVKAVAAVAEIDDEDEEDEFDADDELDADDDLETESAEAV